jgi:hypothetical protein
MHLRQSLFLSSKRSATLETMTIPGYRLYVETRDEEYTPVLNFTATPGPLYTQKYILTITRQDSDYTATEPHYEHTFSSIDELEEHLTTWQIWTEDNWRPDEDEKEEDVS